MSPGRGNLLEAVKAQLTLAQAQRTEARVRCLEREIASRSALAGTSSSTTEAHEVTGVWNKVVSEEHYHLWTRQVDGITYYLACSYLHSGQWFMSEYTE